MAITQTNYTGDGTTVLFSITFEYIKRSHVKATVGGVIETNFTFANATTIQFGTAPANGAPIVLFRETNQDEPESVFFPNSSITASALNNNTKQVLFVVQEQASRILNKLGDTMQGILNMGGFRITNLGPPLFSRDAATKQYVDQVLFNGEVIDVANVQSFGVVLSDHDDPEPPRSLALANAVALQNAINTTAADGRLLYFPEGVVWVAQYLIRKTNSRASGVERDGGSVIKMHGSVHRNMPLCLSSTRNEAQSNIHWSNLTFDFNRVRWSRQRNNTNTGLIDNTSQVDTYGASNIIMFDAPNREAAFGSDTGALTQSCFIISDRNEFTSTKRSSYTNIRCIDGYKHDLDVTAPSYARGRGRLLGPRYYDPFPACGIDIIRPYTQGGGDDSITTHHCYDINFWDAHAGPTSGVRTGNSNAIEVDDGSRIVRFYGKSIAYGSSTGVEVKGHSDSPAPFDVYFEHVIAANNSKGLELRHIGHHSGSTIVTYSVIAVNQGLRQFQISTNEIEQPFGDVIGEGDELEIVNSTGNDGIYLISQSLVDENTGVTTIVISDDIFDDNFPVGGLSSIPSSVADGETLAPTPLPSPTAENVHVDRLTVIAPRRLQTEDDLRVVFRRVEAKRCLSVKAYRETHFGTVECYDGEDFVPDLDNLEIDWLPTDMLSGESLVRPFLRAKNLLIDKLLIRGFPGISYGLYTTGSFNGNLKIGHIDSKNGPLQVLRATSNVNNVSIGNYNIERDVVLYGQGTHGLRLSGANTGKNLGPGTIEGYALPVTWAGSSSLWADEQPVGFSQPVATEKSIITRGLDAAFGDNYSKIEIPVAGVSSYILLCDLAQGNQNIIGTISAKRSNNTATGNHSLSLWILSSSGNAPERRATLWELKGHSSTNDPTLVHITEGGKNWLAIKTPNSSTRPLSGSSGRFEGWVTKHPDLFRIVDAGAEGGNVAASEVPAVNSGVGGSAADPYWTFNGAKVFTQNNIIGNVSESSNVPTGAIIESGSNANGEFVKYADGTQIVYMYSKEIRTAAGRTDTDLTLPSAFIDAQIGPQVNTGASAPYVATATLWSNQPENATNISVATTNYTLTTLQIRTVRSNSTDSAFFIVCTGRWY